MANPELVARLLRDVGEWNELFSWTNGRADLTAANLSNAVLGYANLMAADLTAADLTGTQLRNAILEGATLNGANLSKARLEWVNSRHADLSRTNLRDATLTGVDLREANLSGADLRSANLYDATLTKANLSGADLRGADLRGTDLRGADLRDADLRDAILFRTNLSDASLANTNLSQADLAHTLLCAVDLSTTIGLDTCFHAAPSRMDHETLRAFPFLPVEFLRGCGLQDWEIESVRLYDTRLGPAEIAEIQTRVHDLRAGAPVGIKPIFISYSWKDEAFVVRLAKALDEKKVRYWHDKKDATAGRIDEVLERGISLHPTALVVLSESSVTRPWVEFEIGTAIERGSKLCPIAIDDAWNKSKSLSGDLRAQLRKYIILDFSDPDQFDARFRQLWTGIERHYA